MRVEFSCEEVNIMITEGAKKRGFNIDQDTIVLHHPNGSNPTFQAAVIPKSKKEKRSKK